MVAARAGNRVGAGVVSAGVIVAGVVWFGPPAPGPQQSATPAIPSPPAIVSPPAASPSMVTTQDRSEVRQGDSPSRTPTPRTSREPASSTSPSTAVPPPPSEPSKESAVAGSPQAAPAPPPAPPVGEGAPTSNRAKECLKSHRSRLRLPGGTSRLNCFTAQIGLPRGREGCRTRRSGGAARDHRCGRTGPRHCATPVRP